VNRKAANILSRKIYCLVNILINSFTFVIFTSFQDTQSTHGRLFEYLMQIDQVRLNFRVSIPSGEYALPSFLPAACLGLDPDT